jgi:hypothetical protein
MTAIKHARNTLVFWQAMEAFNVEYYYNILTEDQKRVVEFNDIRKTLTVYESNRLYNDITYERTDIYNTTFPALKEHVISPIASIIYEYYTLNENQRMLFGIRHVYHMFTNHQKAVIRNDMIITNGRMHTVVFGSLVHHFIQDIASIIYDYI